MSQPDYKSLSRGVSRDMSPEAIARRLQILAELDELARTLSKAVFLGKVESREESVADTRATRECDR